MNGLRVCHLTSAHAPFDVRIYHKECRSLVQAGYQVTLVVPHHQDEMAEGIKIKAVPVPRGRSSRMLRTTWQLLKPALRERAEVYHFHDPELIPLGLLLRLCGRRVIYDVHEDLPRQVMGKAWIPRRGRKLVSLLAGAVETLGARIFNGLVAATPAIAGRFPPHKTVIVQNYPSLGELQGLELLPYSERPPQIAYIGVITSARGAREMVQALAMLPKPLCAKLVLAGNFRPEALETDLRRLEGWGQVDYLGWLPRNQVVELLNRSRAGLVLFHPEANHVEAQPTKLFEYMALGLPVVASDFPLWRSFLDGCGLLVDPLDPAAIASAVTWVLENPAAAAAMGEKGRNTVLTRCHWAVESQKLIRLYGDLTRCSGT
ncbi:MAG: glycosyltransferase family 4 protein [Chloroflexi bacterium]|nr:glycosyltransferase family 4 protein [Chloroflexota bacterium]